MPTLSSLSAKLRKILLNTASPITTAARPITIAPRPIWTSAKPWYWLSSAPENATRPLESIRPSTMLKLVLMPCARAMLALQPVARMEQPSSVPKNQYKIAITTTIRTATIRMVLR